MLRRVLLATVLTGAFATAACDAGDVQVWLSTSDGTNQLSRQSDLEFSTLRAAEPATIAVDPGKRYQEIVGFGAALTDASAILLHHLPDAARTAVLTELFGRKSGGLGLSFTRLTIGAENLSNRAEARKSECKAEAHSKAEQSPTPCARHFMFAHCGGHPLPAF